MDDKEAKTLIEKLINKLEETSDAMEKYNIAEYMQMLNNPKRYLFLNFLGGLARGLGIAIGMTVLAALVLHALQRTVVLNLPIIGDFIADIVKIVQEQL